MKVNKELTALCRRFAAAGLRVTERRRDTYRETVERNIVSESFCVRFLEFTRPKLEVIGNDYITVQTTCFNACISIHNDILELIIE